MEQIRNTAAAAIGKSVSRKEIRVILFKRGFPVRLFFLWDL
jgi:hypothetical protein